MFDSPFLAVHLSQCFRWTGWKIAPQVLQGNYTLTWNMRLEFVALSPKGYQASFKELLRFSTLIIILKTRGPHFVFAGQLWKQQEVSVPSTGEASFFPSALPDCKFGCDRNSLKWILQCHKLDLPNLFKSALDFKGFSPYSPSPNHIIPSRFNSFNAKWHTRIVWKRTCCPLYFTFGNISWSVTEFHSTWQINIANSPLGLLETKQPKVTLR